MPTLCLTSAYSITAAANPPRAAFSDLPLGNTAGRPHEPEFQRELLRRALVAGVAIDRPGTIVDTGMRWDADGSWKRWATSTGTSRSADSEADDRRQRLDFPQYQDEADRLAAESAS
ncbi:MAG: hypothetical protein VYC56_04140 [Actinomycetota bacterium]|nr:hypothetical protein [Actinomycetota bacterium]MEC9395325.1 hypothetical protein [Actinomycetota bacterium]MED6328681.1 hypothetical protein [Actinomycetota bacterium]MEE2958444.1 hypothetical protein [Actinomycetota bacterium]